MPVCRLKSILQMVSVSILLTNVSSADVDCDKNNPLPRSTLALDPPSSVILPGEEVSLVCHFPLTSCNVDIYRNHKERLYYVNEVNYTAKVKLEADRKWKDNDAYTCEYQKYCENNRTWACSPRSDPVQLIVTEVLPKPTVSVDPASRLFTVGEQVHINYTTNYTSHISGFYRGPDNEPIDSRNVPVSDWSVIFTITEHNPKNTTNYSCGFEKMVKGTGYKSLRNESVEITVKDKLPKPTFSVDPVSGVVTVGERVQFNCTTSYPSPIFHLYKKYGKKPIETRNVSDSERSVIFTMKDLKPEDSGEYSCSFEKTVKGIVYKSDRSNFVEFNVTDKLPKPTASIELDSGVVTVGERVQFNCTTSYPSPIFHLYKKYGKKPIETRNVPDSERSVIFTMKDLKPEDSGEYSCSFEKTVKGKAYVSERSNFVEFNVTATLPRANISVYPPSGVVSRGSTIRITCTGSILNSGGCFRLYRDGEEKGTLDVSGPQRSATFTINGTDTDGTWNYTCCYSRTVKTTLYQSPRSDAVQVTVKHTSSEDSKGEGTVLIVSVCVAVVLILILIALAGYLCRKKNASVSSLTNNNEVNAAEPDVLYASLNAAALNQRVINPHAQPRSRPDNEETCVYAEMKVR